MSGPWRIVLIISLAVNLFLAGAAITIVGGHLLHPGGGRMLMRGFAAGGFPPPPALIQALPPESRRRLAGILGEERQAGVQLFRAAREARVAAFKAFLAEPYSARDMAAALDASRTADLKAVAKIHDITAHIISGLTPEERAALGATLKACYAPMPPGAAAPPDLCRGMRPGGMRFFTKRRGDAPDGAPPPSPAEDGASPPPP